MNFSIAKQKIQFRMRTHMRKKERKKGNADRRFHKWGRSHKQTNRQTDTHSDNFALKTYGRCAER